MIRGSVRKFARERLAPNAARRDRDMHSPLEEVARIWRDVGVCQIYEGASDIQRLVMGRALEGA